MSLAHIIDSYFLGQTYTSSLFDSFAIHSHSPFFGSALPTIYYVPRQELEHSEQFRPKFVEGRLVSHPWFCLPWQSACPSYLLTSWQRSCPPQRIPLQSITAPRSALPLGHRSHLLHQSFSAFSIVCP